MKSPQLLLLFLGLLNVVRTQGNYGTDFYIGMIPSGGRVVEIYVLSEKVGQMTIEIPALRLRFHQNLYNGSTPVKFTDIPVQSDLLPNITGFYLHTTVPVTVLVNLGEFFEENYLALPVTALGTYYKAASSALSVYILVGAYDNTTIRIMDSVKGSISTCINKMDVFQYSDIKNLSETVITGNKKFSLMAGSPCALSDGPYRPRICNLLIEQMIPRKSWANYFIVPSFKPFGRYLLRSFSAKESLHCFYRSLNQLCQTTKQSNLTFQSSVVVTSEEALSVLVYPMTSNYSIFMTVVPGIDNYLNEYYFAVPTSYLNVYLCIIVPSVHEDGLILNGLTISNYSKRYRDSVPSPLSNYTTFTITLSSSDEYYKLNHTDETVLFGALVYGRYYQYYGFGFAAGLKAGRDECWSDSCYNGGTCHNTEDGFYCVCVTGFTGVFCENAIETSTVTINVCDSNPCQNMGTCWEVTHGYVCSCPEEFYGSVCEKALKTSMEFTKHCSSLPCLNKGTCFEVVDGFVCSCAEGFYGPVCENGIDSTSKALTTTVCSFDVCMNGGLCKETNKNFTCYCRDGFSGRHCEKRAETSLIAPQVASENTATVTIPTFGALVAFLAVLAVIVFFIRKKKKQAESKFKAHYTCSDTSVGINNELYEKNDPPIRSA